MSTNPYFSDLQLGLVFREMMQFFETEQLRTPALDARLLLCHACGITYEHLISRPEIPLTEAQESRLQGYISRRLKGEPVSRIIGHKAFWNHEFQINKATLDPRADTEILVEFVLKYVKEHKDLNAPLKILDLGTGSGCILLSLLSELKNAIGIGVDISPDALHIARHNADEIGVLNRVQFVKSNWLEALQGNFDIIISNPPYIIRQNINTLMKDVRDYDPILALDGGEDGLEAYRNIINQIVNLEGCYDTWLAFEVGLGQAEDVKNLLKNNISNNFHDFTFKHDLSGYLRCVAAKFKNQTYAHKDEKKGWKN